MLVYLPGRKWLEGNTLLGCILAVSFGVFLTNSISFIDPYPPHWELSHQAPLWHSIFVTGWLRRGFCNSFKSSMTMGCCNIIIYVLNIYIYIKRPTSHQGFGLKSKPIDAIHTCPLFASLDAFRNHSKANCLEKLRVIDPWSTILIVYRGDGVSSQVD